MARLGATSSAGGRQPGVPSNPGSTRRLRLVVAAAARQTDTQTTISIKHEAERRGLSSKELFAVAEHHWPQPRLHTRARRAEQRWVVGCARWVWTHRPRRQAVGLVQQLRRP